MSKNINRNNSQYDESKVCKAFGERLKAYRTSSESMINGKKGPMSQEKFAEEIGVCRDNVIKYEKGKLLPDLQLLFLLCREEYMNCEIGYLLGDHDGLTREATDIAKVTGLKNDAIKILNNNKLLFEKYGNGEESILTDFLNYFIGLGDSIYGNINRLVINARTLNNLKDDPYGEYIRDVGMSLSKSGSIANLSGEKRFSDNFVEVLRMELEDELGLSIEEANKIAKEKALLYEKSFSEEFINVCEYKISNDMLNLVRNYVKISGKYDEEWMDNYNNVFTFKFSKN